MNHSFTTKRKLEFAYEINFNEASSSREGM